MSQKQQEIDYSVADTIIAQLGHAKGRNWPWWLFIGVRKNGGLVRMEDGIKFIYNADSKLGNGCMIQLDRARDTYRVTFYTIKGNDYQVHETIEDVYCDSLIELFEHKTGVFLHM